MKKLSLYLIFCLCISCQNLASRKYQGELPSFSYMDGLTTVKKINCSDNIDIHCMACALQGEAANQSAKGMYAVGVTIMTRAKGNSSNVCKVTKARRQFEGMRRKGLMKISKKVWEVSHYVLEKKEVGWTHFWSPMEQANLKRNKPTWATHFELKQCLREQIDDHIFYNQNKCEAPQKRNLATSGE